MTMKKTDKKSSFGMLSVKAGIDNNPNPTQADKIAGAKMKTKKAKKGKMFRNGGNVLVPFIDYKTIAGMGKTKPKSDASKSFAAPPVELNPRYMDPDARASYGSGDYPKKDTKKSRQRGAPTFPATMTVPGATTSIMKQTGTEGKKAKKARIRQENIKYLKDYESGRRQRAYESRIATADFFGSIFGDNSKRKSLADVLTGKKQGGLGVKMAKGGFKKKTPIY